MQEQKSIYELIKDNVVDGKLKEKFSLPSDSDDGTIRFADGAKDGICVYHMGPYEMTDEDNELLEKSIAAVSKGEFEKTDSLWAQLGKKARAICIVDQFQQYIRDNADDFDVATAYPCIFDIVCKSMNKESIKFALEIMELLDTDHDFIKDVVRTIGLSDEFSVFSGWIMMGWENGNDEVFALAKKVTGWGRIHLIDMLYPDTEEIREWLLTEGTNNYVMNAYSAFTCWDKSGAEELIDGELTDKEYRGILTLIDSLLDEGPVSGASNIDNADQIFSTFLSRSEDYSLSMEDYETINSIKMWINSEVDYKLSDKVCDSILSSNRCREVVMEAVKQGNESKLAKRLGIQE